MRNQRCQDGGCQLMIFLRNSSPPPACQIVLPKAYHPRAPLRSYPHPCWVSKRNVVWLFLQRLAAQLAPRACKVQVKFLSFYAMQAIILTQTTPLFEDKDGTIRIIGSRMPLDTIVYEFNQGATAEQIQDSFPSLSLRSIYGAIAFYLEHQAAVDAHLHHREQEAAELRRRLESRPEIGAFRERLRRRRAQLTST